jgi:hypothetical protein
LGVGDDSVGDEAAATTAVAVANGENDATLGGCNNITTSSLRQHLLVFSVESLGSSSTPFRCVTIESEFGLCGNVSCGGVCGSGRKGSNRQSAEVVVVAVVGVLDEILILSNLLC